MTTTLNTLRRIFSFFFQHHIFFFVSSYNKTELHMLKQECTSVFAERWSTPEIDPSRTLSEPESEFNVGWREIEHLHCGATDRLYGKYCVLFVQQQQLELSVFSFHDGQQVTLETGEKKPAYHYGLLCKSCFLLEYGQIVSFMLFVVIFW